MNFYIMTLFPEMIESGLATSILGRAVKQQLISFTAVNIRDYSLDKHHRVDDYPYGGGAGMVMAADPVVRCCRSIEEKLLCAGKARPRVVYLTPQGRTFNQHMAAELAKEEDLILLCGHYEGIDERAIEMVVTDQISIGDYVLTGGELPAMVVIDTVARLVPGVLGNQESAELETFHNSLLEYPQYTRPEEYEGRKVPDVLLSGHHANIEQWRRQQSILRTAKARPDLMEQALPSLNKKELAFFLENQKNTCNTPPAML